MKEGGHIHTALDEQVVFSQLGRREGAVWSLLLAAGYLKAVSHKYNAEKRKEEYELALTNMEVNSMFQQMITDWFSETETNYNSFIKALLCGNVKMMNRYMNYVALGTISGFGRYDIMMKPKKENLDAVIIEFKVLDSDDEETLEDTATAALAQMEEKKYGTELIAEGIPRERIRKYGFAFEGKTVLVKEG